MLIDNKDALTAVDDCNYKIMSGYEWIRKQEIKKRLKELPSAESEAYNRGWKDGQEALRKEIWEDGRDRLD